jgi:catalase
MYGYQQRRVLIALALALAAASGCSKAAAERDTGNASGEGQITRSPVSVEAPATASAVDFIEIFEQLNGNHPGVRKGHARGVCATGQFIPDTAAAERFASPLFVGEAPVVIRFSMAGGNPEADERARSPRGIGLQFQLADDQPSHHLAGLSVPLFAGKNPQQFLGLLRINRQIQQGEATPEDRERYLLANPEAARQGAWVRSRLPAAEYTSDSYYGVHTFIAETKTGSLQPFRWQLVPEPGEQRLTEDELTSLPEAFLERRLAQRLAGDGDAWFLLQWVLGEPGDTTNDPSMLWPDDREKITVGRVQVTSAGDTACVPVNFDPNRLAGGVRPSDDPVLRLRSAAYAISQSKRLANQ